MKCSPYIKEAIVEMQPVYQGSHCNGRPQKISQRLDPARVR
jgi:hypothetical protein